MANADDEAEPVRQAHKILVAEVEPALGHACV